ncbi:hypothetical protein C8Q80DRAFT_1193315 [Daedaleopsis nitida]|nr:hypothetical protein C8Q80DRAFT_1193315 [Daedaleopsis nitida]
MKSSGRDGQSRRKLRGEDAREAVWNDGGWLRRGGTIYEMTIMGWGLVMKLVLSHSPVGLGLGWVERTMTERSEVE